MWLLSNTVWMSRLFCLPVIPLIIFFLIPLLFVGQYSVFN
ncbi:retrotransposon hot spot (RHS) protein, putative, partial [Trypanosoma cruzi]